MDENFTKQLHQTKLENSIAILHRTQIDRDRWDSLVLSSGGPLYSTFDYLNCCGEWEAVVFERDHLYWHAVPIPYREHARMRYVYQSPFACFVTLLSRDESDETFAQVRRAWLERLGAYKYLAKYFFCNSRFDDLKDCHVSHLGGLKIDLTQGYQNILKGYSHNRSYEVRKPNRHLVISMSNDLGLFFRRNAELPMKDFSPTQLTVLKLLWEKLWNNGQIEIYFATLDGELISGNLIGKFGASLYSLAAFSTLKGRQKNALALITDQVLKKYAQSDYRIFDFGSMTGTGIDNFKLSFGAERYPIYQIYRNNLPWYINVPKKALNFFRIAVS